MAERGIRVVTTPVGDRYVLEALHRDGGLLGGEQSGHIVWLGNHVAGDGLAASLLLCRALSGRRLSEAAAVMTRLPQAKENVRVTRRGLPQSILEEADRLTEELGEKGACSFVPREQNPLCACLRRPKLCRKQGKSVLASPRSSGKSSASPTEGAAGLLRVPREELPGVWDHRIRRIA